MKKLLNSLFLLTALTLTTSVFTGCKDEPDKYEVSDGNPTISYIRPLGTESADSLLTGAYMDNGICIVGKAGHKLAVGVGIVKFYRKLFQLTEELAPYIKKQVCRNIKHEP